MICAEGTLENPKCYSLETFDFNSEEQIFDTVLDVLKSELPARMANLKDCDGKPMFISEDDIDLIPAGKDAHFELMLNPVSDLPNYTDNRQFRSVEYVFELVLTVHNTIAKCITWELIRFKNAIEGLIIATEFVIDGYQSTNIETRGFNYYLPEVAGAVYRRQGSYKFAVIVTQEKI